MKKEDEKEKVAPLWDARIIKCREYLKKHRTIKMAIIAAEKELFFASKVAWISAVVSLGKDSLS